MQNTICQKEVQDGKSYLPNPFPAHKLIITKKKLHSIMEIKGWTTYTAVAEALGFTRQYVAMIANGTPVSAEFITRMAMAIGSVNNRWDTPFQIVPRGNFDENHPVWNQQKHDGKIPYDDFSISAEFRNGSYPVEKKRKSWEIELEKEINLFS